MSGGYIDDESPRVKKLTVYKCEFSSLLFYGGGNSQPCHHHWGACGADFMAGRGAVCSSSGL
jgi:hypothetical protein